MTAYLPKFGMVLQIEILIRNGLLYSMRISFSTTVHVHLMILTYMGIVCMLRCCLVLSAHFLADHPVSKPFFYGTVLPEMLMEDLICCIGGHSNNK